MCQERMWWRGGRGGRKVGQISRDGLGGGQCVCVLESDRSGLKFWPWTLRTCVSDKFPSESGAASPWTTLSTAVLIQ